VYKQAPLRSRLTCANSLFRHYARKRLADLTARKNFSEGVFVSMPKNGLREFDFHGHNFRLGVHKIGHSIFMLNSEALVS
jgi:hypothetical protein